VSPRAALSRHTLLSFALIAFTYQATSQAWIGGPATDPVVESLIRRWLLWTFALANLAGAFVVVALPAERRAGFLARHAALYLLVPLVLLLHRSSAALLAGQLGAVYVALVAAIALHLLRGLWDALGPTGDRAAGVVVGDGGIATPPRLGKPVVATPFRLGDRQAAALLGAVALAVFLALLPYHRAVQPTASDEPHYLLIVQSLLYDHDLDLRNDYEGERYRAFYPDRLPDMHGIEVGRAVYPIRDLGLPLVSAVPFAVAGRTGVLALICVLGALLAAQLFLLARDLGFRRDHAFLATALVSFTHPVLTYTTQVYPDLAVALVFSTVARLLRRGRATRPAALALASALTALLPLLSTRAWLIAAPVMLVVVHFAVLAPVPLRDRAVPLRDRVVRAIAAGAPFAAVIGALVVANGVMFGVYLPSAGYFIIRDQQQVLAYTPHVGGFGLLFDRVFGLVGRAPLYLLALLGLGALWARRRTHGALLLVLGAGWLAYFVYIASIAYWWADGSPPSRYLLGSIPFLAVAVAGGLGVLDALRRALRLGIVAALAWASAFVTYVYAVLPNLRYDLALEIRARNGSGQLWDHLGRVIRPEPGDALPSLVALDPASVALAAAWAAMGGALVVAGFVAARGRRSGPLA
jgi:hypothetical protein